MLFLRAPRSYASLHKNVGSKGGRPKDISCQLSMKRTIEALTVMQRVDGVDHELQETVSELVSGRLRAAPATSCASTSATPARRRHPTTGGPSSTHACLAGRGCVTMLKHQQERLNFMIVECRV